MEPIEPGLVTPLGAGSALLRVAAVVPVVLLVLFTGLLQLLGLVCDRERRLYVTELSRQAMEVIGALLHGAPPAPPLRRPAADERAIRLGNSPCGARVEP